MYKTKTSNVKKNLRNVQQFYNLKRTLKHSSHKQANTNSQGFSAIYAQNSEQTANQQAALFNYPNHYLIDIQSRKTNTDSTQYRNKNADSVQQVYNQKKNAYKNYIRQIYQKINEEIRKKHTCLAIQSQNSKQIDHSKLLIAIEIRPAIKSSQTQEDSLRNKIKQQIRFQKFKQETFSLQKASNKLFNIKKSNEKKWQRLKTLQNKSQRLQKQNFSNDKSKRKHEALVSISETEIAKNQKVVPRKLKQSIFSLISIKNQSKINIEDFIPAKKILNKKDPFVCGLSSDKQSNQQKNRQKIVSYIDFLWRISYSVGLYAKSTPEEIVYRAYVGPGNNSIMIKSIIKRRYWWVISDKSQGCNLIWSQLKQNSIFKQLQQQSNLKKENLYSFNFNLFLHKLQQDTFTDQNQQKGSFSLFNSIDNALWQEHLSKNVKAELLINQRTFLKRASFLEKKNVAIIQDPKKLIIHNHLQHNYFIGNKKALFYYMKRYYELNDKSVFDDLPLTFHIAKGIEDQQYQKFIHHYNKFQTMKKAKEDQKNIWILKPGEYSNRGNGITVCHSLDDILVRLKSKEKSSDGNLRTFILQKYIQKPLLYKGRKFDIRHYLLVTCLNGIFRAYWYPQGYIRTSSSQFTLKRGSNLFVHLTNDAIQKKSEQYGKYEKGNKISYQKFQQYLDKNIRQKKEKNIFFDSILPQMKQMTINAVKATYLNLDDQRKQHNFQLLGMDFMIDQNYKPWLIQINTNPCLELSCPILAKLIPSVIQNTFKICVDPLFPPSQEWSTSKKNFLADNTFDQNKFQLIFDQSIQGQKIEKLYRGDFKSLGNIGKIQQDAEVYENDGLEQWQGQMLKKQE